MEQLVWLVQVKWPSNVYFESIAAFDCKPAAMEYARECRAKAMPLVNPLVYRVRNLETTETVGEDES